MDYMKNVYVFGNPDVEMDSLPIKLIPALQKQFPEISFIILDPNEEWDISHEITIIDTVVGIKDITLFNDLKHFTESPKLTCHDFDAFFNLLFLQKLGKLSKIKIIGIPPGMSETDALSGLTKIL
jgi:hypothetical protein